MSGMYNLDNARPFVHPDRVAQVPGVHPDRVSQVPGATQAPPPPPTHPPPTPTHPPPPPPTHPPPSQKHPAGSLRQHYQGVAASATTTQPYLQPLYPSVAPSVYPTPFQPHHHLQQQHQFPPPMPHQQGYGPPHPVHYPAYSFPPTQPPHLPTQPPAHTQSRPLCACGCVIPVPVQCNQKVPDRVEEHPSSSLVKHCNKNKTNVKKITNGRMVTTC
jgi:hypothetical protein